MDVDASMLGEAEHGLRQDLSVGCDDDQVGSKPGQEFKIVPQTLRLVNRHVAALGLNLDGRGVRNELAATGTIRLGDHGEHLGQRGVVERREAWAGEVGRPHVNDSYRLGHGEGQGTSNPARTSSVSRSTSTGDWVESMVCTSSSP